MLFAVLGRSVLGKTVPGVLSTARGRRSRAILKTKGTVFPNTDRPRTANNVFIFFFGTALKATFMLNFILKKFSSNLAYARAFTKNQKLFTLFTTLLRCYKKLGARWCDNRFLCCLAVLLGISNQRGNHACSDEVSQTPGGFGIYNSKTFSVPGSRPVWTIEKAGGRRAGSAGGSLEQVKRSYGTRENIQLLGSTAAEFNPIPRSKKPEQ